MMFVEGVGYVDGRKFKHLKGKKFCDHAESILVAGSLKSDNKYEFLEDGHTTKISLDGYKKEYPCIKVRCRTCNKEFLVMKAGRQDDLVGS